MAPGGGSSDLVTALYWVDRYGAAIEYDLHERFGLDLLDFFRGRYSWAKLIRLLEQMPRASRFMEAQASDRELAEHLRKRKEEDGAKAAPPPPPAPPLSAYTLEAELLTGIGEQLGLVVQRLGWIIKDNRYKPKPWPRPLTASDRIEEELYIKRMDDLVEEILEAQTRWVQNRDQSSPKPQG